MSQHSKHKMEKVQDWDLLRKCHTFSSTPPDRGYPNCIVTELSQIRSVLRYKLQTDNNSPNYLAFKLSQVNVKLS